MTRLPQSGSISGSQIGVYTFSRGSTAEFSLSASFQQSIYGTIFENPTGLQWPGYTNVGTLSNLSYSDWYKYAKSKTVSLGPEAPDPNTACENVGGQYTVYVDNNADLEDTEWSIFDVAGGGTYTYTNAQGTTNFNGGDSYYAYAIIGGNYSVKIDTEGKPSECTRCP
jgi:hypothetical protein